MLYQTDGFQFPRQFNSLYYLCGIEPPGAYLRLDGRSRTAPRCSRMPSKLHRWMVSTSVERLIHFGLCHLGGPGKPAKCVHSVDELNHLVRA